MSLEEGEYSYKTPKHISDGISKYLRKLKEKNMQIQGTIANIQPDGGYDSQGGWINTFLMTINTQNGPMTGQIGSKSPQYPMQIGEFITVQSITDQHGVKFKKINPQYQGGQQQPRQQQQRPQQQGRPQQQPVHQPLPSPDATGRMIIAQVAAKIVSELMIADKVSFSHVGDMQVAMNEWFTAIINVGSGNVPQTRQQNYGQSQVPHQYSDEQSQIPEDDIPF